MSEQACRDREKHWRVAETSLKHFDFLFLTNSNTPQKNVAAGEEGQLFSCRSLYLCSKLARTKSHTRNFEIFFSLWNRVKHLVLWITNLLRMIKSWAMELVSHWMYGIKSKLLKLNYRYNFAFLTKNVLCTNCVKSNRISSSQPSGGCFLLNGSLSFPLSPPHNVCSGWRIAIK